MNPAALDLLQLFSTYGYFIIFLLIVVEGPATIFISGFFVSLGLLNPIITYLVVISADLFGDILYYAAGRWWINSVSKNVLKFFRISSKQFNHFKKTFIKNKATIMFFGKLSSFVGGIVMYVAGLLEVSLSEFLIVNGFGALFKTLLLLFAGYYLGSAMVHLGRSFDIYTTLGLIVVSAIIFAIYYGVTSFSNKYIKKVEK